MIFHEAFWLADATIGPVVVLAQIVAVGRFVLWRGQLAVELPRIERKSTEETQPISDYLWSHPIAGQGSVDAAVFDIAVRRHRRRLQRTVRTSRRWARIAYVSVALSLTTVGIAVYSLAWQRDVVSVTAVADIITASLVALLAETVSEVRLRLHVRLSDLSEAMPAE